jgi:hypothetical protein
LGGLRSKLLLVGARIERFYLSAYSVGMRGKRIFIKVSPRARFVVEVAIAIDSSN